MQKQTHLISNKLPRQSSKSYREESCFARLERSPQPYTQQWYLPNVDVVEIDAARKRLEATDVWVRRADGSREAVSSGEVSVRGLLGYV